MIDPWFVTGLTDGEGCFCLLVKKYKSKKFIYYRWSAIFSITLRGDDVEILHKIKEFFGSGYLNIFHRTKRSHNYGVANYQEVSIQRLAEKVIPHFDQFPLQTKKVNDFNLWREAVLLLYSTRKRKRIWERDLSDEQKKRLIEIHMLLRKRLTGGHALKDYRHAKLAGTIERLSPLTYKKS